MFVKKWGQNRCMFLLVVRPVISRRKTKPQRHENQESNKTIKQSRRTERSLIKSKLRGGPHARCGRELFSSVTNYDSAPLKMLKGTLTFPVHAVLLEKASRLALVIQGRWNSPRSFTSTLSLPVSLKKDKLKKLQFKQAKPASTGMFDVFKWHF